MNITGQKDGFSLKAYQGDARTLLAFNLQKEKAKNLAGFTIQCRPDGKQAYYLFNNLSFKNPAQHAQDATEPAYSSINAPIHKFRWVHVPGSAHQGTKPVFGPYTYTVTPRYFDGNNSLKTLDPALSVSVILNVEPFSKGKIEAGFTRGFTQSQAFVRHFSKTAVFRPKSKELLFDTSKVSGKNDAGKSYTFAEEYAWLGFTARDKILGIADEVLKDKNLRLDVFAYDLNEPDIMKAFLALAKDHRIRVILDNAGLHHDAKKPKPEDEFENLFSQAAKMPKAILRGKFGRYSHDKVLIVSDASGPLKVLTGSTNFSVTGLYVNSNHVLIFNDKDVAAAYAQVFANAWNDNVSAAKFIKTPAAGNIFSFSSAELPQIEITFSPHDEKFAKETLGNAAARIAKEENDSQGSVLFAVMGLDKKSTGPIIPALNKLHSNQNIFSYGISDTPDGIFLYTRRRKTGVLVTGKPTKTKLPPPFNQVPGLGLGHQVHHKFVVCGFSGQDPVVYCGSSNLALLGEQKNGDNLIAIHDNDIATVFAIEAIALVDHFDFLDRQSTMAKKAKSAKTASPSKQEQAEAAGWFLSSDGNWADPYYDESDLRCADRKLFA
jgi:phosphatidylserine/phosphatidylglycerophosphate/cardiolipin synthase-like enzyme